MSKSLSQSEVKNVLLDDDAFVELLDAFEQRSISEECDGEDPGFSSWYRMALDTHIKNNSTVIDAFQESPIEKIFLRSLLLGFVKADPFGLVIHQFGRDALQEVEYFREYYGRFKEFIAWWERRQKPFSEIEAYLDSELIAGRMEAQERNYLRHLTFRYYYLMMDHSVHLTIQPNFPNVQVDGRGIRPDLYFWSPERSEFGLIVECDGFQFHSSPGAFSKDRKRDRVLAIRGLRTLRFSGSEITNTPVDATRDILELLWKEQGGWLQ
ncbi:endonuclease domain-containing protein [Marinobacter koreensis]|uniref:Endonuclease domain-containing protein n=1 Tax=Marinobacter koreensis TaxID=335974 RepID=A0ABW0RPV9_9GAMM|nr:DUF559 domain-containing protein [Marinobacter koreensis]MCK7547910.1 endonuclease domain-containing protein [Marinobacter koreensis]